MASTFPIDLSAYKPPALDPWATTALSPETTEQLDANIQLFRDAIVTFTACGAASGYGGHTGGAFDTAVEVCMLDAMFQSCPEKFVPVFFDEAGHRVATQYLLSAIRGALDPARLCDYRKGHAGLPGHPERDAEIGVEFASGRLGHMFPYVNGVAMANPDKVTICLGSDGSQMEGNDAEAARLAVAQQLNIKVIVDDNDVTIAGKPSEYQKGYSVAQTLRGHGMTVLEVRGERTEEVYAALQQAIVTQGPVAVCILREMVPGIPELEGTPAGHDVISVKKAIEYLEKRNMPEAIELIQSMKKTKDPYPEYLGAGAGESSRMTVAEAMCTQIAKMSPEDRKKNVIAIDSDLEGSTGLKKIREQFPEIYVKSGIMERGNFSACAGFGREEGKQGIFSTFCAFLEMVISEIFMARLNKSNVLCHFSHSGVDEMADNTCHFGLNLFFADNGLADHGRTPLYFPADPVQARKMMDRVFWDKGIRMVFSLRSKVPQLLDEERKPFFTEDYVFATGKDDELYSGTDGYVVAVADAVWRANDAVQRLRREGLHVGLICKSTLNIMDEALTKKAGRTPFVLVVEPFGRTTSLGLHYGYWLAKLGLAPAYDHLGAHKDGCGGLWEHAYHQGYDSASIQAAVRGLHKKAQGSALFNLVNTLGSKKAGSDEAGSIGSTDDNSLETGSMSMSIASL